VVLTKRLYDFKTAQGSARCLSHGGVRATVCLPFAVITRGFLLFRKVVGTVMKLVLAIGLWNLSIFLGDLVSVWKASFHEKNLVDWLSQVEDLQFTHISQKGEEMSKPIAAQWRGRNN
jgi:hypothetical protein